MAPTRIYQKCEEPEQTIISNLSTQTAAGFPLKYCKCASEKTHVLILYILNGLSFLLWIILLSLASKYSEMASELEQLRNNQTVLRANGSNMENQLKALHSKNSAYGLKLNESLNMLASHKELLKGVDNKMGNLETEARKLRDNTFKLTDALYKINASACRVCPEGWLLNKGHCYHFRTMSKHWSFAKTSCEEEDSQLIIINDEEEQKFLDSQKNSKSYWIGLHDISSENKFIWVDNSSPSYTHWNPREPNNYGHGEDCVEMTSSGFWNDRECGSTTDGWICEKPWQC
nr:low affinity immunoglobulin epsilon Fc receptor [Pogona vitticeps]